MALTKIPGSLIDSGDNLTITDLTVTGNLSVTGTSTSLETATLQVEDKNIVLNYGSGDTSASADGAGITIQNAIDATADATFNWGASNDRFKLSHGLEVLTGNVGIGTDSPAQKLEILDTSTAKTRFAYSDAIYGEIGRKSDGNYEFSAYENGANLIFGTSLQNGATTERMRIDANGKTHIQEIAALNASLEIGNGDEKQIFDGGEETIEFQTADTERMRITNSGVTYATGVEVRQHYATDGNSYKRYTAPLNPKIATAGLQLYVDPTRAQNGTDFSGNNHNLTFASGSGWGSNSSRSYFTFDGTSNTGMYGNPDLSSGKACSFSYWVYHDDVTSLNGGYHLSGIQKGNHYMYVGIVQGNNDSAPMYGYIGQGTNMPQGGSSVSHEGAYINSDEWSYLTIQCGHNSSSVSGRSHGRAEVYLNGALVQRRSEIALPTVAANGSTDFWLGRVAGGYYLSGLIGPAVVYTRMLSQWEILENMRVHADMYTI